MGSRSGFGWLGDEKPGKEKERDGTSLIATGISFHHHGRRMSWGFGDKNYTMFQKESSDPERASACAIE